MTDSTILDPPRSVTLKRGETVRFAGADIGSLTLLSGAATFADQDDEGEAQAHVLDLDKQTNVSEFGDVWVTGYATSTKIVASAERKGKSK